MRNSNNKSVIAFVIPSMVAGGMERVMAELANYFAPKDHLQVNIILFGKRPKLFYHLDKNVIVHTINNNESSTNSLIDLIRRIIYIRKTIKLINPTAVLAFGTQWNNLVLLALKWTNFPVFVSDRGSPIRKYSFYNEFLKSLLYPTSEAIIVQTKMAEEITRKRFPKHRIEKIGNPINEIIQDQKIEKENIILSVGRLIKTKHQDRLIQIFSSLNAPNWKLVIIGANALGENNFDSLVKLVNDLDLSDRVFLLGEKKQIFDYYLKSKIFAFTSSVEGFPNVIGEALSAGLPVVSYDCVSGPSELIKNGENGFLVDVFDDTTFKEKLQFLIDNPTVLNDISKKSSKSIGDFSSEKIGEKFLEVLLH
jgi:GalNAc-alpha-(1->4)-GalNAc-alpha-(1->3)-diNAcBac-PP-undecaprenol alpha-1,4-N-acetyl-D-galactosaminyltransferase